MVKKVIVLGAGVSGLSVAYELLKKGIDVEVIEKSNTVGGLAKTVEWNGNFVDMGPHTYHSPDQDIVDYWNHEFPESFFIRDHWAKNFKNNKFYDYPISKEFINQLHIDEKERIKTELANINLSELVNAKNYYEYTRALAGPTLQKLFFIHYPEKLWGMKTTELDANWAPKRIEIREKSLPFYHNQWAAVGKNGSGSILNKLKEKILKLKGKISLDESIESITFNSKIEKIHTSKRVIDVTQDEIVINTLSYTNFCKLSGIQTNLKYRGVALVLLEVNSPNIFPKGVDFLYIDDQKIIFNRISDQNSFIAKPQKDKTVICLEITYSPDDSIDNMNELDLINIAKDQFLSLSFVGSIKISNSKLIKLPEVYPMYFLGYRDELSRTKEKTDSIRNLYNHGSLAEFAYSDLQILFSKSIDLAELITNKTYSINKIGKHKPEIKFNKNVELLNSTIGDGEKCFVIAEIGLNHNGDLDLAKELIDQAIFSGADAVKLQSYRSEDRVVKEGKTSRYVEKVLGIEETDYELLKKNELSEKQTIELFEYARGRIEIFSAPFDVESAKFLSSIGVSCFKIASFDIVNFPLLRYVASTGLPIILSTGMSYLSEVEDALMEISRYNNKNLMLLQCTSVYPCPPESMNIKAIDTMRSAFGGLPVGLSDHVNGDSVSLAAVARGANIIEKHFTLSKKMEGPDHVLSLEPQELKDMVTKIRLIESALGSGIKQPAPIEHSTIFRFRKTMYFNCHLKQGTIIQEKHISYKGPAIGIYAKFEELVIGKKLKIDVEGDTPITWDLIE